MKQGDFASTNFVGAGDLEQVGPFFQAVTEKGSYYLFSKRVAATVKEFLWVSDIEEKDNLWVAFCLK